VAALADQLAELPGGDRVLRAQVGGGSGEGLAEQRSGA